MSSFCTKCGNRNLNSSAKFCSKCGSAFESKSQINTNLELNKNLSHIDNTLFIIPNHFKNNLEALLKKYNVQSKGIVAISNPITAFQDTKKSILSINNLTYICIIGTWSEIPPHKVENPASSCCVLSIGMTCTQTLPKACLLYLAKGRGRHGRHQISCRFAIA